MRRSVFVRLAVLLAICAVGAFADVQLDYIGSQGGFWNFAIGAYYMREIGGSPDPIPNTIAGGIADTFVAYCDDYADAMNDPYWANVWAMTTANIAHFRFQSGATTWQNYVEASFLGTAMLGATDYERKVYQVALWQLFNGFANPGGTFGTDIANARAAAAQWFIDGAGETKGLWIVLEPVVGTDGLLHQELIAPVTSFEQDTPEPATLLLVGCALLGLSRLHRRRA